MDPRYEISCSEIGPKLWLGNVLAAKSRDLLSRLSIKRVLTVREWGIELADRVTGVDYFHIKITDTLEDNILTHIPESHTYIRDGLNSGQGVLIHCHLGVSRSASIVISYLMVKDGLNYDTAYGRVKLRRPFIKPNREFENQLRLWDQMGRQFDHQNRHFRQVLLKRWIFVWRRKIVDSITETDISIVDAFWPLTGQMPGLPINSPTNEKTYKCGKCLTQLFCELNIVSHLTPIDTNYKCSSIYTEPLTWMVRWIIKDEPNFTKTYDVIQCPNCKTPVGQYDFRSDKACNCIYHKQLKSLLVYKFDTNNLTLN